MASLVHHFTALQKDDEDGSYRPAGEPRTTPADAQMRHQKLLARVRKALEQNTALRLRVENRSARLRAQIADLGELATQAVAAGRDDLALLAIQQRQLACVELDSLQANILEVQLERQQVARIEQSLTAQIQAMQVTRDRPMEGSASDGASRELIDLGRSIEQTEQRTVSLQARAYALEHLAEFAALDLSMGAVGDPLSWKLGRPDMRDEAENQLARLKRSQARNPTSPSEHQTNHA